MEMSLFLLTSKSLWENEFFSKDYVEELSMVHDMLLFPKN